MALILIERDPNESDVEYVMNNFEIALILLERQVERNTKWVKNLMTGKMIEIDFDTPRSCDPSTELYWSM